MKRIYLDNNATTPLLPEVREAMRPWLEEQFGNAASVHWYGQRARAAIDESRGAVARLIGATDHEIVFTSSGTEADNLAIRGVVEALRHKGNHVAVSSVEHPAVLQSCAVLERHGFQVTYVAVNSDGILDLDALKASLRPDTVLVSVMLANNETGVLQPVQKVSEIAKAKGILVHTDAVQAVGKIPVQVDTLGVDLLSLSAHKIHGPQGVGALYVRKGVEVEPLLVGGGQERKRRAGSENVAAVVGFGRAAEMAGRDLTAEFQRLASMRDEYESQLLKQVPSARINGGRSPRVPNTSNIGFPGIDGEALLMALDLEGVAASLGAACSSGTLEPSHVLKAMKVPDSILRGSLRFSLGRFNVSEEMSEAVAILSRVLEHIQSVSTPKAGA
ncbi:MAG: cysteine desulfurase family protein [Acidobacteriia bacterium]|nr:cysteine desulfurase family protein [Terriglobia bacterium]